MKKSRSRRKVDNNKNGRFDTQISLFDLPLDDIKAILESVYSSASPEEAASALDQKLNQSSSSYRKGDYRIVFEELSDK